jgi:hypothetical protein
VVQLFMTQQGVPDSDQHAPGGLNQPVTVVPH